MILEIGRVDDDFEQQTSRVHDHMALASVELFGSIMAMRPATVGRFHRLTVDDPRTWRRFASSLEATALA